MTREQATALLDAMAALKEIEKEAASLAWNAPSGAGGDDVRAQDYGRLAAVANVAEDGLFAVLTVAEVYARDTAWRRVKREREAEADRVAQLRPGDES